MEKSHTVGEAGRLRKVGQICFDKQAGECDIDEM